MRVSGKQSGRGEYQWVPPARCHPLIVLGWGRVLGEQPAEQHRRGRGAGHLRGDEGGAVGRIDAGEGIGEGAGDGHRGVGEGGGRGEPVARGDDETDGIGLERVLSTLTRSRRRGET